MIQSLHLHSLPWRPLVDVRPRRFGLFGDKHVYPIRDVGKLLKDRKLDKAKNALEQWVMWRLSAPPTHVVMEVARSIARHFPPNLICHELKCCLSSLYERSGVNGSQGGGVMNVDFSELVRRLAEGVDNQSLGLLTTQFNKKDRLDLEAIKQTLSAVARQIQGRPHVNDEAKKRMVSDVMRLNRVLKDIIEQETDCPICWESMTPTGEKRTCVASCCTNMFHEECLRQCARCPMCRAPLQNQAIASLDFVPPADRMAQQMSSMTLEEKIDMLAARKLPKPVAVVQLIKVLLQEIPNASIIISFHIDAQQYDSRARLDRVLAGLRQDVSSAIVYDAGRLSSYEGGTAQTLYRFSHPQEGGHPQVLVVNSGSDSETAAGIAADADYMIMADTPSAAIVQQLLGRVFRAGHGGNTGHGRDGNARVFTLVG